MLHSHSDTLTSASADKKTSAESFIQIVIHDAVYGYHSHTSNFHIQPPEDSCALSIFSFTINLRSRPGLCGGANPVFSCSRPSQGQKSNAA